MGFMTIIRIDACGATVLCRSKTSSEFTLCNGGVLNVCTLKIVSGFYNFSFLSTKYQATKHVRSIEITRQNTKSLLYNLVTVSLLSRRSKHNSAKQTHEIVPYLTTFVLKDFTLNDHPDCCGPREQKGG